MDRKIVQARSPFSVTINGAPCMVGSGDLFYDDDPVVRKSPGSFGDVTVRSSTGPRSVASATSGSVETASSEPGGRRRMSRTPKVEPIDPTNNETSEV